MREEQDAALTIDDIAPVLGQHQLTIMTLSKQNDKLRARIMELENNKLQGPLPEEVSDD